MKVVIIGGTGAMGRGLAMRLAENNEVHIGSRSLGRARSIAREIPGVEGASNIAAALWCEVALISVPFDAIESLREFSSPLGGKLVVSTVNPVKRSGRLMEYALRDTSAAELVASILPKSAVATAFNNVPEAYFRKSSKASVDILIAADTRQTYERAAKLILTIPRLRPLYVGPLTQASSVERLTVLLSNAAVLNGGSGFSVKFVS